MDTQRKETLIRLLENAIECLAFNHHGRDRRSTEPASISMEQYREFLGHPYAYSTSWQIRTFLVVYKPKIQDKNLENQILSFIRTEPVLARYMRNDGVVSYFARIMGGMTIITSQKFMEALIDSTILSGAATAARLFDKITRQNFVLSEIEYALNAQSDEDVCISGKIRITRHSNFTQKAFMHEYGNRSMTAYLDKSRSSLWVPQRTSPRLVEHGDERFRDEFLSYKNTVDNDELPAFNHFQFCNHLSLFSEKEIRITHSWVHMDSDELLQGESGSGTYGDFSLPSVIPKISRKIIEDAAKQYREFINLDQPIRERLEIPINYLAASKGKGSINLALINLGTAMESLYLSPNERNKSFRMRLNAAWHLGATAAERERIMQKIGDMYKLRSAAVHEGKITIRWDKSLDLLKECQKLCHCGIAKMIKDRQIPTWNKLILG